MAFTPHPLPRFGPAARALVRTLEREPGDEQRAAVLSRLGTDLGDRWYPVYLKLLMVIGGSAPEAARRVVADALANGLQRGLAAGGTLGAWGVPASMSLPVPVSSFMRRAGGRPLDPMAYLVVWHSQVTSRERLPREVFEDALASLLNLFAASATAAAIYQARLRAHIDAATEGVFGAETLHRLRVLRDGWIEGAPPRTLALRVAAAEAPPAAVKDLRAAAPRFV